MSSWKLADGGAEFPRYTSEHPLRHPVWRVPAQCFWETLPHLAILFILESGNIAQQSPPKHGRSLKAPALSSLSRDAWRTETVETDSSLRRTHARTPRGRMSQCRVGKPDLTALFLCLLGFLTQPSSSSHFEGWQLDPVLRMQSLKKKSRHSFSNSRAASFDSLLRAQWVTRPKKINTLDQYVYMYS